MRANQEKLKEWMKETLRMYRRFNRGWIKMAKVGTQDERASAEAHIRSNNECITALKAAIERL